MAKPMPSWYRSYEPFGFLHIKTPLPPGLAHAMGYFDDALAVGFFYDEPFGRILAVTDRGVTAIGHDAVMAAVLNHLIKRDESTLRVRQRFAADDTELALLVEPGVKGGYYIGTPKDLFALMGQRRPDTDDGFAPLPPRLHEVTINKHTFPVSLVERVAFNGVSQWLRDAAPPGEPSRSRGLS